MSEWSPVDLLPGLWVGVLALLLGRALRRWYDPLPGTVVAAFGLVLVLLFGPVLFGGKILLPLDNLRGEAPLSDLAPVVPHGNLLQGDLIQLVTPSLLEVRRALAAGQWPLWNPRAGAGVPLLADPQAQALQPLVLLAWPLSAERAAGAVAALRVLVALTFTFLLLRRQTLGTGPALAGAMAFGLGGFLLLWLGWPLANTAALLPLVLYALTRVDQIGGRRDRLLLALATFTLLLAGHPETILDATLFAAAFLAGQVLNRERARRLRLLRDAGLAALLGAMLAAPALLPTALYLPQTLRAARLAEPMTPAEGTWLPIAAPNALGNSRYLHYWGPANTNEDASGFAGTATLLAALLTLLAWRAPRLPQERLVLGTVLLAVAAVARLPGLAALLDALPALGAPGHRRLLLLVNFCLAYLAACTLERFRRGEARRWPVLVAAAALAALITWGYLAHPDPADPATLAVFRDGWLRWQMRFLAAAALLLLVGKGRRWMPPAFAVLVAAELLLIHMPANPPMPPRLAFPTNRAILFLQDHLGDDRMAALGRAFPPNLPVVYGLADARAYNPAAPAASVRLTEPITMGWDGEVPEFGRPDHPLYGRLGVRYLLTAPGEELPPPFRLVLRDAAAWIWERPDPLPRAFLVGPDGPAPLTGLAVDRHRISGRVGDGAAGARLATSVAQDGGWKLVVDGRRRPTGTEAGVLVTARLPAGAQEIELVYRPPGFLAGCAAAALALALGIAWLAPPPRRATARAGWRLAGAPR